MPPPLLQWEPESREAMKARFMAALSPDINFKAVARGEQNPPGMDRKHVFDLEEGVRMIVSIDCEDETTTRLLHLSFGMPPWSLVPSIEALKKLAFQIKAEMLGLDEPVEQFTTNRAFHLFFKPPA